MKSEKNILIAFILNLAFSAFEFLGGFITGSIAIISDAVHDIGDSLSIGISYFLEKKSKQQPDENYTYGYARYSVMAGAVTTLVLLVGSVLMILNAIEKIINPTPINYDIMIIFAIVGVAVNSCAVIFTHSGESLNQKSINLHMLEDALGWIVVLIGAVVMRFTDFALIDPLMSVGVSLFILINSLKNMQEILGVFLEKTPRGTDICEIKEHVLKIDGVLDVHHIHIWSIDGHNNYATMHIVTDSDTHDIKDKVKDELKKHGISHATLELERKDEHCHDKNCNTEFKVASCGHHHHH